MGERFILTVSAEQRAKVAAARKAMGAKSDAEAIRRMIDTWVAPSGPRDLRVTGSPVPSKSPKASYRNKPNGHAPKPVRNPRGWASDGTPIY